MSQNKARQTQGSVLLNAHPFGSFNMWLVNNSSLWDQRLCGMWEHALACSLILTAPRGMKLWRIWLHGDFNAFLFFLGRNVNSFSARSLKNVFNSLLKAVCTRLKRGNSLHIHVCNLIQANLRFVSLLEFFHLRKMKIWSLLDTLKSTIAASRW